MGPGCPRPDQPLRLPAALAHGRCDDQLRRHRRLGRRPRRPVRRVPAAGPWPPPLADRRQRIHQGQAPPAGVPQRRRTQAAAPLQAHPRLGARARRHAVPAAQRPPQRRGRRPLPDLLLRHARARLCRAHQRLPGHPDHGCRRGHPLPGPGPEGARRPQRNRRRGHGPRGPGPQRHPHERPGPPRRLVRPLHHHLPRRR